MTNTTHDPAETATPHTTQKAVRLGLRMGDDQPIMLGDNDQHLLLYASEGTRSVAIKRLFLAAADRGARVGVIDLSGTRGNSFHAIKPHVQLAYDIESALQLMATAMADAVHERGPETWLFVSGLDSVVMPRGAGLPSDLPENYADAINRFHDAGLGAFWAMMVNFLQTDGPVRVVFMLRHRDFVTISKVEGTRRLLNHYCSAVVVNIPAADPHLAFLRNPASVELLATYANSGCEGLGSVLIEHRGQRDADLGYLTPLEEDYFDCAASVPPMRTRWA